ncbi:MAG: polysaccharide deacetylase family protein, partial [Planctomycetota bacterium]
EEKRIVIALFDSLGTDYEFDFEDPVHQVLEMPLNYLGMVVRRHDIRKGRPPVTWLDTARALVTFFDSGGEAPRWLWPWLEKEVRGRGLRVVHVGDFGPLEDSRGPARLVDWLAPFGLAYDPTFIEGPLGIRVEYVDRALCALEADPVGRAHHRGPRNVSPRNRIWVRTTARFGDDAERVAVATGPWGGLALNPWAAIWGYGAVQRRWHIDPFFFFREALGLTGVPAPHPQVLNGRRMFFLHVDGDGFEGLSTVRPGALSGAVLGHEVLKHYALPYTVSVIVASLTEDLKVSEPTREMRLAREILNLPNVEAGSHGVLHPIRWDRMPVAKTPASKVVSFEGLEHYEYSPSAEVRESVRFINERLMEPGNHCRMVLWTGHTNASEQTVLECARLECMNINGGVFRWDPFHDSVGFVSPWARCLGDAVQVYAGAANENDFEGFYDTMPGAFAHIDKTIERAGSPRILKPANIYIHFYSAESPARLVSIHRLIRRWALKEPTAPVFASTYCRAVHSAIVGCRIFRQKDGWDLREFGDCRSARLDGETRHVDWERSDGLLGSRRMNGSLFLHLAGPSARVILTERPNPQPHVEQANHLLREFERDERGVTFLSEAFSKRLVVLKGFPPQAPLYVSVAGEVTRVEADENGRFELDLGGPGRDRVRVESR